MKKFRYQMQNILNIKFKLEDLAKTNYSLIRIRLTKEEEKLKLLKIRKEHYKKNIASKIVGTLNFKEINLNRKALNEIERRIKVQEELILNIEIELDKAREKLESAMIERKTQESLKERAFEEYKQEYNSWENKQVDELNSFKYANPN